jgi:hypothetical protein
MPKRLTLALSLLLLAGCVGRINRVMASWQGHHYHELIARWGPPQQVLDDGGAGRILVWSTYRETLRPQTTSTIELTQVDRMIWGTVETTRRPGFGYLAYRMFWVSKSGTIYRWAWRGW